MNKVILIGRLVRDPDVRYTQGMEQKCIARYTLAVDRTGKKTEGQQSADFVECVAFGQKGEFTEKYFRKGMKVAICGHIQTGRYTNHEGQTVYTTNIAVDSQEFCESKGNAQVNNSNGQQAQPDADGFMQIPDGLDEKLPWE